MKRLLTILFVTCSLLLSGQTYVKSGGSFVKYGGNYVKNSTTPTPTPPAYTFQPETQAFWARLTDSTSVDISWKYDFDSLVVYLKDTNIWSNADAMYLYAFENATDALLNIVGDTNNSTNNGSVFTAKEGYKGDAASAYVNTHFNPASDGVKYTLNDAAVAMYRTELLTSGAYEFGASSAGLNRWTCLGVGAGTLQLNSDPVQTVTTTNELGLLEMTRTSSAGIRWYLAGTFTDKVFVSSSITENEFYVNCFNNNGSAGFFSNSEIAFLFIGASLSDAQVERLDAIIAWWLVKISDNP